MGFVSICCNCICLIFTGFGDRLLGELKKLCPKDMKLKVIPITGQFSIFIFYQFDPFTNLLSRIERGQNSSKQNSGFCLHDKSTEETYLITHSLVQVNYRTALIRNRCPRRVST